MARAAAAGYVNFFRNTPLLIVLFFLYFGLPGLLPRSSVSACTARITRNRGDGRGRLAGLGGLHRRGAAGRHRGGPPGQLEAASSTGLPRAQAFRHVVFPQLAPIVLPSLTNEAINIVKNSTYGMTIGLTELIWQAQQIEADTFGASKP